MAVVTANVMTTSVADAINLYGDGRILSCECKLDFVLLSVRGIGTNRLRRDELVGR